MMVGGVQCVVILNGALAMDKLPVENLALKSLRSTKWLLILLTLGVLIVCMRACVFVSVYFVYEYSIRLLNQNLIQLILLVSCVSGI